MTSDRILPPLWLLLAVFAVHVAGCDDGGGGVVAVGTIERDRVELIAEAAEPIVAIAALEGERVAAGEVVLRLDERRMQAEVTRSEGAYGRTVARLAELERGPRQERIDEARAALAGAEATLARNRLEMQRARTLRQQGVGSQAALDDAQAAFETAQARFVQAGAELQALLTGTTEEELDQARAAVGEAAGALEAARIRHQRMTVRAPVAGQVDALPFELGEQPPIGATVAVLLAGDVPYARVYVPQPIRARVKPGTPATVTVDGVARRFAARVRTVSGEAAFTPFFALTEKDRGRLTYLAELDLLDAEAGELPTGLPAEARFEIAAPLSPDGAGDE
jgi:HlyD family secretion protein